MSVSASLVFEITICLNCRILNKYSDDKPLVNAMRRHFIADHLFSDQHQEQPLLRWRERGSYVDRALLEKLKDYEALLEEYEA